MRIPPRVDRLRVVAVSVGLCAIAYLPHDVGPAIGILAAMAVLRWMPLVGARSAQDTSLAQRRALPLALDVLSLALDAGVSWDRAVLFAAGCTEGALEQALRTAAARLAVGAAPAEVWQGAPVLVDIGLVVERSFRSGAAVSSLLRQHADALRAADRLDRIQRSRKLGTKVLMPVTFLGYPGFIALGLVPTIVSTVSTLGLDSVLAPTA